MMEDVLLPPSHIRGLPQLALEESEDSDKSGRHERHMVANLRNSADIGTDDRNTDEHNPAITNLPYQTTASETLDK